jgi:hypothetical protein
MRWSSGLYTHLLFAHGSAINPLCCAAEVMLFDYVTAPTGIRFTSTCSFSNGVALRLEGVNIGSGLSSSTGMKIGATSAEYLSFWGKTPLQTRQTVTGSKGGNAALASLMSTLASYGLVNDSTT